MPLPPDPAGDIDLSELPPPHPDVAPDVPAYPGVRDVGPTIQEIWSRHAPDPVLPSGTCCCGGLAGHVAGTPVDEVLLQWVQPLLAWARGELRHRLREAGVAGDIDPLFAPDTSRLTAMLKRVLVRELHAARVRGALCGDTPVARFGCFAAGLTRRDTGLRLLVGYPALARELVAHLRRWIDTRTEFAVRLHADLPALREAFGVATADVSRVDAIEFGAGDPHRNGRSVAVVTVSGTKIVYKPRPLAVERHLHQFIDWLNARGLAHPLRPAMLLDQGPYGWSEFVESGPCADDVGVDRFYWRCGAYLAVFYLLRAYDMHMYNVIAAGEHPVFIDLEAMFHAPAEFERHDDDHGEAVGEALRNSVLASLLLPQPQVVVDGDEVRATDISGLAGRGEERLSLHQVVRYEAEGTDQMRVVRQRRPGQPAANRPALAGVSDRPAIRKDQVVAGFTACYRLLAEHRETLLAADGPMARFAGDPVRAVLRQTRVYASMLDESWHPELLTDGRRRWAFFAELAGRGALAEHPEIVASELRQLSAGDVPVFGLAADGTTLHDPDGEVVPGFLERSGLACVRRRAATLSDADLESQSWFTEASLATVEPPPPAPPLPEPAAAPGGLREAATTLADRLVRTALRADPADGPEWLTLNVVADRHWVVGRTSLGLGSGVTGIALFLAELDALVGEPRYRRLVADLVGSLVDDDDPPELEDLAGLSVGAYEDLGSLLYLVVRLRELWRDPGFGAAALRWLLPAIARQAAAAPAGDVVTGAAGAALALLTLWRTDRSELVATALKQVADAVVSAVADAAPRPGFGHGLSGHGYVLAALADATGDESLARRGVAALQLEPEVGGDPPAAGWCDGLAGMVLARTGILGRFGGAPPELLGELRSVADRLAGRGEPQPDDSLCHGALARAEALRAAGVALADETLLAAAEEAAGAVARRVLGGQVRTGVPGGVWVPGLLTGAAGIGYGLIRAAAPEQVPNVLLLGTR